MMPVSFQGWKFAGSDCNFKESLVKYTTCDFLDES